MPDIRAFVFDAYGTLFDVHSVMASCREVTPDPGALSREWRAKQLEYTWLRALMGRYQDFWEVTGRALGSAPPVSTVGGRRSIIALQRES